MRRQERGNQMVTPREDYYPAHDGGKFAPILATTVATWRARAFLENLAVDAEGAIFVTVYSHNRIARYDPATRCTTGLGLSGESSGPAPSGNGANFRTPPS